MTLNDTYLYGTTAHASSIETLLDHLIQRNETLEAEGKRKIPLCIWGGHGIGKTQLVEDYAKRKDYDFVYIAPAQFEEMGDLLGMPQLKNEKTEFAPPSWVPTAAGTGILLIDDVNRADDRILRGMMQLLQNYELVSWKLPKQWHIVLTANPDTGDYSVTSLDEAMLTRMLHITMVFDLKNWAKWANRNGIHPNCINFVLTHPEVLNGHRTTPRTLVQFFEMIQPFDDFSQHLQLIEMLANATIDKEATAAFLAFIQQGYRQIIPPEIIVNTVNFDQQVGLPLKEMTTKEDTLRVDILATICTRLILFLDELETPSEHQLDNLKAFIKLDFLPNELKLTFAQDLVQSKHPQFKRLLADPEIGQLLLKQL